MTNHIKDSHCAFCGTKFTEQVVWPRKCFYCYNDSYKNPLPVVVTILNVWEGNKLGTLIQKRNIEPKKDQWAFTGGYIDNGETWQEAAVREVREELGLETDAGDYLLADVESNTDKSNILIFALNLHPIFMDNIHFVPNHEVSAIRIVHEAIELAFPTHTAMLKQRFEKHQ